MEQKKNIRDAIVMWKYEFNNNKKQCDYNKDEEHQQDNKQIDNFEDYFHIFDFGFSYDLKYLVIFEDKTIKQNNTSRRIKGRHKSDLRIILLDVKACKIEFESSLILRGFLHINFHFTQDSNFLICQGYWNNYLIIDIQQKKEFVFNNLEESHFIFQMDTINNLYLNKDKKIYHVNLEQINQQQEKEIYLNFNFNFIIYFKQFLVKYAFISTDLFQYIIQLQNFKIIKQRKKQIEVKKLLMIFKNCVMIEQENIYETEYSIRLLNSWKLLRRIKTLCADSGNLYQDENGVYKYSFINTQNPFNYYQVNIFDLLRGTCKEIFYGNNSQYNNAYQISKYSNQLIFTMTMIDLFTQIICYSLQ